MNTPTETSPCPRTPHRSAATERGGFPERSTLQERIKFDIECLFGSVGGSGVYEQLGLADVLDEQLETAETVELIALSENIMTWHDVTGPASRSGPIGDSNVDASSSQPWGRAS